MDARVTLLSANTPGAVAIVQITGSDAARLLTELTGHDPWPPARLRLCDFAGIDHGLAGVLPGNNLAAQLMPHGGPRVVQRLIAYLVENLGAVYDPNPDASAIYPEASSPIEADALAAIARSASPAAIDVLASQAERWADVLTSDPAANRRAEIAERSREMDQLLMPATVVVVGPANVGKSTLTNHLMGRSVSIVADLPGTTRDWVGGVVELTGGVALRWLDTPGLRDSDDPIEQRAISLALQAIGYAAVIIAMRDPQRVWPDAASLPREPDLWLVNKVDDATEQVTQVCGESPTTPLPISAEHGRGIKTLERLVLNKLGLSQITHEPWAFSPRLKAWCEGHDDLSDYL